MPVAVGVQYVNIPVEIDTKTLSDIAQTTDGKMCIRDRAYIDAVKTVDYPSAEESY